MKILTWNTWFGMHHIDERMRWILSEIEKHDPDIVCLQEVSSISKLTLEGANSILSKKYLRLETKIQESYGYWERTYSKLNTPSKGNRYSYRVSSMGRALTLVWFEDLQLAIGNTHLESLDSADTRVLQVKEVLNHFEKLGMRNNIFLGDLNLINGQELHDILPMDWMDVWRFLEPTKPGYTYDFETNKMIQDNPRQCRIDRIYFNAPEYKVQSIQMIGLDGRTLDNGDSLFPSDHFGLVLEFEPDF